MLWLALALAVVAQAQAQTQPSAEWVHSPEPLKQAWGAHVIGEDKLTAFVPDLLRILELPDTSADADAARFAALDALIQLKAEVPVSDLEPLTDRFPTDVLILAARSHQDASSVLLKLLDREHNREAFVAIGDLLAPTRNPGFVRDALKEFCQSAAVWVYNPGQLQDMGSGWSGDTLAKTSPPREGWPAAGSYQLVPGIGNTRQSWALLAQGTHSVSYIRTESRGYADHGFDPGSEGSNDNTCLRAEEFLAQYAETTVAQLPVRSEAKLDLVWSTPEAFELAVRKFITRQRALFALLAARLAARGYLTADQADKLRLNLRIYAQDARLHDRTPLPNISEWAKPPEAP